MYGGVTVAGGDLTGLYPNPTIAANAVTGPKLQSDATVDANRAVGTDHIKDASVTPAKLSAVALGQFMPIGSIVAFSATTIPANWAECNGAAVLRASYPDLHTLYSLDTYPWGAGNGVTTFNLPNLMGYFLRSRSADAAVDPDGPRAIANVQADKVKTHTHDIVIGNDTAVDTQQTLAVQGDNTVHTTFTSSNQTPAGATETRPKNVAVIYIVKVL
jgi:microcystin-dependent protein